MLSELLFEPCLNDTSFPGVGFEGASLESQASASFQSNPSMWSLWSVLNLLSTLPNSPGNLATFLVVFRKNEKNP